MPLSRSERRHYVLGLSGCLAVRLSGHERLPCAATFLYYTNMFQQIEFIIYANIQPLRQKFFTKGQGHRSKIQRNVLLTRLFGK